MLALQHTSASSQMFRNVSRDVPLSAAQEGNTQHETRLCLANKDGAGRDTKPELQGQGWVVPATFGPD